MRKYSAIGYQGYQSAYSIRLKNIPSESSRKFPFWQLPVPQTNISNKTMQTIDSSQTEPLIVTPLIQLCKTKQLKVFKEKKNTRFEDFVPFCLM